MEFLTSTSRQLSQVSRSIAIFLFSLTIISVHADSLRLLKSHIPGQIASMHLSPFGRMPTNSQLALGLSLPLRDPIGLTNFLRQLYDPASTNFHRYLSPEQFTAQFGPSPVDYETVSQFARAHQLVITRSHANRSLLMVKGAVADIEKTFHVQMRVYHHPTETRDFFAPDSEPAIESNVPITSIQGLNNYTRPRPMNLVTVSSATAHPAAGAQGGDYVANDFRAAYVPGVLLTGVGQTVALVEFDDYYPQDIVRYETAYGLPAVPLTNIYLDSFVANSSVGADNLEVALDIEMVASMAPGISKIAVYQGDSPVDVLTTIAEDNSARQISCSWLFDDGSNTTALFQQMAAQGQSFFTASGDDNSYAGEIPPPADDPNVIVVGGTFLTTTGPSGAWTGEATWNRYNNSSGSDGSGGGISTRFAIPSWQQGIDMTVNGGSTTMRNIPDVAIVADGVYVIYGNGTGIEVRGTSCSAPLWTAYMALVNQKAAAAGQAPLGFVNPALYALAKSTNYTALFHDVTTGNNTNSSNPLQFFATPGYDLCTGWGSPTVALIDALVPTPPILLSTVLTNSTHTNGPFTFRLSRLTGQGSVVIQASTNLVNWNPIFTNPPSFGQLQFTDTNSGIFPRKFYRTLIQP